MAPAVPDPLAPLAAAVNGLPAERRRKQRHYLPQPSGQLQRSGRAEQGFALIDLASNDYLGLACHPTLQQAAQQAIAREGLGAGGSRLVSGGRPSHQQLESALATWLGRERVLTYPSGFQANLAAVQALADRHTLVLADRLVHHSLLTGVKTSGAQLQRFAHNTLDDLEQRLVSIRQRDPQRRLLVISESLFSMEGSSPNVSALSACCQRHGAALLLDEAHALGVLGQGGRGLGHGAIGVHLISGTFGKAFGSGGAFLAGNALIGDWLLQHSGPFRYTTALAPPLAAGALAALQLIESHPDWGAELLLQANAWRDALTQAGWPRPAGHGPIVPLLVGDDRRALELQQRLEQAGLLAVAIRPPTVPPGSARLRLVVRRGLPAGTLEKLIEALGAP